MGSRTAAVQRRVGPRICDDRRVLDDVLAMTEAFPTRALAAGEDLFVEGDPAATLVVLEDGELVVNADGVMVNRHTAPGSFIGEIGSLLGMARTATVTATTPTVVRELGNPDELFAAHPQLALELARQLAVRMHRLTTYITDVRHQFADRDDHLGVFGELLSRIAARPPVDIEPGSDRSPDS
jgi:CRP/FNR family transcriptional regulator, cyclic AMP receptor protein